MGILILLIIVLCIGIILLFYARIKYTAWTTEFYGFIFLLLGGTGVAFSMFSLATLSEDFAYLEEQYNNLKAQLEVIKHDDIVTGEILRNQVLDMNNTILKHKCYSRNMWVGIWYSEHIGTLEPLYYPRLKK